MFILDKMQLNFKNSCFVFIIFYFILTLYYQLGIKQVFFAKKSNLNTTNLMQAIKVDIEDKLQNEKYPLTIVCGYYDITRIGRPKEDYFKWINQTIKLNAPIIFFIQAKYKNVIVNMFESSGRKNFKIITVELEDLEYYQDIDAVKEILSSENYQKRVASAGRIECTNPLYSIVIFSKLPLLVKAARLNPFNSKKFLWVDAGISRFFFHPKFNLNRELTGKLVVNDSFYISFERERASKQNEFQIKDQNIIWSDGNYFLAGIMGGSYNSILNVSIELKNKWKYMLEQKVVNNEQMGLIAVYFEKPYLFNFIDIKNADWYMNIFIE